MRSTCIKIGIVYFEYDSVVLVIQYAKRTRGIIIQCHMQAVWLYRILPHYLINYTIFWERSLNLIRVFSFFLQGSSETFPILRRIQRNIIRMVHRYSCKVPVIPIRFQSKLEFPQHIFEKYSNIKFQNNPYSKSGKTGRQIEVKNLVILGFSQVCRSAPPPKKGTQSHI